MTTGVRPRRGTFHVPVRRRRRAAGARRCSHRRSRRASDELSTSNRLCRTAARSRPATRAYSSASRTAASTPTAGTSRGEMGGVWTPPLKLVDGVWFGIDDQWVGPATTLHERPGLHALRPPGHGGPEARSAPTSRPTGSARALFGLTLTNPARRARTVTVKVDAHSELMGAYPWGFNGVTPERERQPRRPRRVHRRRARSSPTTARCPGAPEHHYAALVGSDRTPASGEAARPAARSAARRATHACQDGDQSAPERRATTARSARAPAASCATASRSRRTAPQTRVDRGRRLRQGPRRRALASSRAALRDPAARSPPRSRRAASSRASTQLSLPGDRAAAARDRLGQAEPRRPHASAPRTCRSAGPTRASSSRRRWAPSRSARWFGAGFPDYPWIFATDGEYTAFAGDGARPVPDRRGPPARAARHLRRAQRPLRHRRARDGLRRLGLLRPRLADDRPPTAQDERLQHRRDDQVPEHRRADLALDRRRPLPRRHVRLRQAQPARGRRAGSTSTRTAGPRARATSSGRAWARRSSTTASTTSARCSTSPTWRAVKHDDAHRRRGRPAWPRSCRSSSRPPGGPPRTSSTPTR